MKLRATTLDRIADALAQAVSRGDFEAAEGWIVAARYVADREADRTPRRRSRFGAPRSSTVRSLFAQ